MDNEEPKIKKSFFFKPIEKKKWWQYRKAENREYGYTALVGILAGGIFHDTAIGSVLSVVGLISGIIWIIKKIIKKDPEIKFSRGTTISPKINNEEIPQKNAVKKPFKIKEFIKKLKWNKIILIIFIILVVVGISYFYYKTQIYKPRVKIECNEIALHQAVDSYYVAEAGDFLNVLAKNLRKSTLKENYYNKSIEDNLYNKNQYEQFYKQCLRSNGIEDSSNKSEIQNTNIKTDISLLIEQCKAKAKTEARSERERKQDSFIADNFQEILDTHCNKQEYSNSLAIECASTMMDTIVKDYDEKENSYYDQFYSECLNS